MTPEEALVLADHLIEPERLNTVQELVLYQCWLGKTYQEIAVNSGYDADYIRVVGSRLWQTLSDASSEKITKNNVHSIFRQLSKKQDKKDVAYWELPEGSVPINSQYYVERPPLETSCYGEINKPGSLIRIKGSQSMGKTSLMMRILAQAETLNYSVVSLNLQQADRQILSDLDKFLRWICANVSRQLNIKSMLDDFWDEDLGSKVSSTTYLQGYILRELEKPLVFALDEVNRIFEYQETAQEFLPLLRFWHEESNNLPIWQKMRLIVVHSTEIYTPLNLNQSPFNVGLAIKLPEFDVAQISELAQRYQINWSAAEFAENITALISLIGGHPYLLRLAFDHLARQQVPMSKLIEDAHTQTGIYCDRLRGYLVRLQEYPELGSAFKQVIEAKEPITLDTIPAYKLESIGLVTLIGDRVIPSCELYRLYFEERLDQF